MIFTNLIVILALLTATVNAQLNAQELLNRIYANKTESSSDSKQSQINDQIRKCSSPELHSQCNVCSLCENDAYCRAQPNKNNNKSTLKLNPNDQLSHLRELVDFICYCVPGYTGDFCQTNINECLANPCSNNATCVDGVNSFECKCPLGFKGKFCDVNINECDSSPCKFNSKCVDLVNGYACECTPGYTGPTCATDIDECEHTPCQHNATCLNLINKFKCDCAGTGFHGDLCQLNINDCLNVICQHNGTCVDGVNSFECKCPLGFKGQFCEIDVDECASSPCVYGKCWENSNPESFLRRVARLGTTPTSSRLIQTQQDQSQQNYQLDLSFEYKFSYERADGYFCECTPGYTGSNCETKINECESSPCGANGECVDLVNEFKCNCLAGYTGVTCQENLNECELFKPCAPLTKCVDLKPDYLVSKSSPGYKCDCAELNLNLFNKNMNKHVQYAGQNCTLKLNSCETRSHLCQHNSECESLENDIKCLCTSGYTGKYCDQLTTIRLDGTYSPRIHINDSFNLKFKFRVNLNEMKQTLLSFDTQIEIVLFKKYMKLNHEKLAFYDSNTTWHSIEILKNGSNLTLIYSVDELNLLQSKTIRLVDSNLSQIQFAPKRLASTCLRDVTLDERVVFKSSNNDTFKYGCDLVANECDSNYCKNEAKCVYKWFSNECTACPEQFYGARCHLEKTKLGFLNKSPVSPLSAYMTLNLLPDARADTFQMGFQITRVLSAEMEPPEQFLFLTLKQMSLQSEQYDFFYILSVDEKGYLNLKKIQVNLDGKTKSLKWSLSNDKLNLSEIVTFNASIKLSEHFIEINLNSKHVSRYELVDDAPSEESVSRFEIEQIKFSNNFIINNSVSFLISDLMVNNVKYEFASHDLSVDVISLSENNNNNALGVEIVESLNLDLFNSSRSDADIVEFLNLNEQNCPTKNCYKLKENREQEIVVRNLTCHQDSKQCQRFSSIRRYLFRQPTRAELTYTFDFQQNILDKNDFNKSQSTDTNALNKRRIRLLREVDFYSVSFDLNLNYLNLKQLDHHHQQQQTFNLFQLNSLDDSSNLKFLFGLNLVVLNSKSLVKLELFTLKQSIQSLPIQLDNAVSLNATFTFGSITLLLNNSELIRLSDKNVNLFYASQLKAYSSFQLSLISSLTNNTSLVNASDSSPDLSLCLLNFALMTRKTTSNEYHKYSLIDQTKSINLVDDLKLSDLNEQCSSSLVQFDEQEQRSFFKSECYLVSKFNVLTNEKNDYYTCKCNQSSECSYNFWSKLTDQQEAPKETDLELVNNCDFACFNNGTCVDNILNQTDSYLCLCPKYFTGKRCEQFDACLANQCSSHSKCKAKFSKFVHLNSNLYECECSSEYIGEFCTIRVEDTCLASPCVNGGVCSNVTLADEPNKLTYECACPLGYEGKNCQEQIDFCALYEPCSNGASCANLYNAQIYKCSCAKGWKGVNCTQDIDECDLMRSRFQLACSGNGQCINTRGDHKCACNQYYYGRNCEHAHVCKQESRPCENGAVCLVNGNLSENKYVCKCAFGYTGVNCAYATCDTQPCRHDAPCEMVNSTSYECNCTSTGYAGAHCETLVNDAECHLFACENNTCDPNRCDCKAINCQEYISKTLRARPRDFMYHYVLWPLLAIMFALLMVLFSIFVMKMKKSRATHGTYSPSRHELQASRIEFNMDLKRPPEERLI